ncbi:MAG: PepSY domain-containing protein [Methylococcales bacterium]|nr:PepSY domain-containing protein [Methylococcales bacterium]
MKTYILTLALTTALMIPVTAMSVEKIVASANAKGFKEKVKFTEAQARKIALKVQSGTIKSVVYEIESNGEPVYDFSIQTKKGAKVGVEVSAVSGKIVKDDD